MATEKETAMSGLKRTRARFVSSTLGVLAVTLLVGVHPTVAQTVVSSSTTFTADPACTPGAVCVDIIASAIQVNGAGHIVDCGGSGVGIRISGQTNVHLHSFEVRNCSVGILIQGGSSHHLNELNVHDNNFTPALLVFPPPVFDGDGLQLEKTTKNHVNGSQSHHNDAFGVRLTESHDNTFNTMVVVSNVSPPVTCGGYKLDRSNGNIISSNDIATNGDVGVWLLDSSDNIVRSSVIDNTFFTIPTTAVALTGNSDGNIIRGNQTNSNENGVSLGCPTVCAFISFATAGADNNIVQSNTSLANFNDGIQVGLMNTSNVLQGNTALTNVLADLSDGNPACDMNIWKGNTFVTDRVAGLPDGGPAMGCIR
jgi:parallel beta-helix repeat protein